MISHLIVSNHLLSRQLFNSAIKVLLAVELKKHAFILNLIKHILHSLLRL